MARYGHTRRTCTACGVDYDLTDHFFLRSEKYPDRFSSRCRACGPKKHKGMARALVKSDVDLKTRKPQRICKVCCDLPHARQTPRCPKCREPRYSEPPPSAVDMLQYPAESRVIYPATRGL